MEHDPANISAMPHKVIESTDQEHGSGNVDLRFWTKDGHDITRRLLVWESDQRVCLLLNIMDKNTLFAK